MKKLKKIIIISLSLIFLMIIGSYVYFSYFFDLKTFEKTIKNKVYSVSGKKISFESITFSFKHGIAIKLKNLNLKNNDNSTIFSTENGYINVSFFSLFKKQVKIKKIFLENGIIFLDFQHKKKNKKIKRKNIFNLPTITLKNFVLKNFNVIYKDSHLNINTRKLYLNVKNFSFNNFFNFKLKFLWDRGTTRITGKFNFNNSFSPSKMLINAHIISTNIFASQFYSYFTKKAHFEIFNGDIEKIDAFYKGNLKGDFNSNGFIILKNFTMKHEKFKKVLKTKFVKFSYHYKMNHKDIILKKFNLNIDDKVNFIGSFRLINYKNKNRLLIIKAKSKKPFNILYAQKISPYSFDNLTLSSGKIKIKNFTLHNKNFKISTLLKNICGTYKYINFEKINGQLSIKKNIITFSGSGKSFVKNYYINNLAINNATVLFNLNELSFDLKNILNLKSKGNFKLNANINYKNYKNINILIDNGSLNKNKILSNIRIKFNNIVYKCNGEFGLKNFKLTIKSNQVDPLILKKINIVKANGFKTVIFISGNYKKPKLVFGKINFNKGFIKYQKYEFNNINGMILCNGNSKSCKIKNISFYLNNLRYILNGEVKNFMNKNLNILLNIKSNGIAKEIFEKIKINSDEIKNVDLNANLNIKVYPSLKLTINNCSVIFKRSYFHFLNHYLENVVGKLLIKNNNLFIKNIEFLSNSLKYKINGKILNLFQKEKIFAILKINSNGIDKFVLSKLKLGDKTVKNANVNANLKIKFYPKFSLKLESCKINFNNSKFDYKGYNLDNIKGTLFINLNTMIINNIKFIYNNILYQTNGKLLNIYNTKKLILLINVKTFSLDKTILKLIGIKAKTIKNVEINTNLKIKFFPKFNLLISDGYIIFKNSNFILLTPSYKIKNLVGKILIAHNNLTFDNIHGKFKNGNLKINGTLKENYINLTLSGENFNFKEKTIKIKKGKNANNKTKKIKNKLTISSIIKKLKEFSEKFSGEIKFNFKNIALTANYFKIFSGKIKLKDKILTINDFNVKNSDNGTLELKNFLFDFSKKINIFKLAAIINKFNPYDFTRGKISGLTKNCIINLSSKFKKPSEFTKDLNGFIFISIKKGYIHKFTFLNNLFSILNVSQLFKFKLPDLSTKGLKYKIIAGKMDVENGIFKTDKFVLLSDSINLGFKGKINSTDKKIKGEIVVQPLQTIGNIIGKIPLIGYIFGRKIILLYFKITGSVDNPKIMLQPSKTITKKTFNIFKNIFKLPKEIFTNPEKIFLPGVEIK